MKILDFEYINEKDEIVEVPVIEIDFWYNMNKYTQALMVFGENKDTLAFAEKILPEMILTPSEFKSIKTFDNDFQSLTELITLLIEVQAKKQRTQPKKKAMTLKMD